MLEITSPYTPVDYVAIGHVTQDQTESGMVLGGTVSYAALTARALGLSAGIVTACSPQFQMPELAGIPKSILFGENTTTFKNIETGEGRIQYLNNTAPVIDALCIPNIWKDASIIHLGPVAQEIDPKIVHTFSNVFIGLTIQGWLRDWDENGRIQPGEWPEANFVMEHADAAVFSIEDIANNELRIEELVSHIRVLVVTEGSSGSRVYWNGDMRYFRPPKITNCIDTTGAGDIFATAFFIRLKNTRNPWEAARFATEIAAGSTQRPGLQGIPTVEEINYSLMEILQDY